MSGYSVYLDDSGHPVDKPYMVLGGFIAREEQWIAFEERWNKCLQDHGIGFPFHATDFFAKRRGDRKLKYMVNDLVRTITNHVEAAFSVVIDIDAYKEFNRESRLEEFSGTPYAILTRLIYKNVDDWQARTGRRLPTLYFVEDGTLHKGDMMDCMRDRDQLTPPIPLKKENVACQAADLYAYAVYQTAISGEVNECFAAFMRKLPTLSMNALIRRYSAKNLRLILHREHRWFIPNSIPMGLK